MGKKYPIEVKWDTTIEELKKMAVGHFFSYPVAVGEGEEKIDHRIVLVREARTLDNEKTVRLEQLQNDG